MPPKVNFKLNALALVIASAFINNVNAETYFNPAFLSSDTAAVADLSRFGNGSNQLPGVYRVDIYLNGSFIENRDVNFSNASVSSEGVKTASVKTVSKDDTGLVPCLSQDYMSGIGLNMSALPAGTKKQECFNFEAIKDASVDFEFEKQRLNITIPQAMISNKARGYIPPDQWDNGLNALLLNYNFTGSNSEDRSQEKTASNSYFLGLNSGLNLGAWRLRDYAIWTYNSGGSADKTNDLQHISTYLQRAISSLKANVTVGDSYTPSEIFDSLAFRGVQLASDDNMLPDSLRGFAPTIRGIAKSNAQVTIKQNGYVIYQSYVSPGAFLIDDLYPTSSSGDLLVEVKESDGSITSYSVPYSSVPVLQREGRLKYAATAGEYRSNSEEQEEVNFFQGTAIYGLPHGLTVYGGTQQAENYSSYAFGLGANLGDLGALSADMTHANTKLSDESRHYGQSVRFLYAKSLNKLGTNFQLLGYRYSTSGFYTLEESTYNHMAGYKDSLDNVDDSGDKDHPVWVNYYNLYYTKRGKVQASISQQLGAGYGSTYLTGSEQSYWHTDKKDTLLQVGYNNTWHDISYNLSFSHSKTGGQPKADEMYAFNISVPLSKFLSNGNRDNYKQNSAYLTYGVNTDNHNRTTQNTGVNGTLLQDNNLSYSVQQGYGNQGVGASGNANIDYQATYGNANMGYSYSDNGDYQQVNYGLSGGVVAHSQGITLSQPLGDTNILIAAPGADGVSIENNTGVKTDWRGYAVVPYANTYRVNRVALDTNSLNDKVDIDDAVVNVVPTMGALVRADFKAHVGLRGLVTLLHNGKPVPFGATVNVEDSENTSIVGDAGVVYISGLPLSGIIKAKWGESADKECKANFNTAGNKNTSSFVRITAQCL